MLFTITTTYAPATDLGYLLRKDPARVHCFDLSFGRAQVFFPEATVERCTAALILDVDPVGLVRRRRGSSGEGYALLAQYVNDRPYVASSFLSVAISRVYGSAMTGASKERPELAKAAIPLEAKLAVLPCRGGEGILRRLFEPLGYEVSARRHPLDEQFPEWGQSPYYTVILKAQTLLRDLIRHIYILIPVLDDDKHYWVSDDEVEKLLKKGEGWLASHPEREMIAARYLKHQKGLVRDALARLMDEDNQDPDSASEIQATEEAQVEKRIGLNEIRLAATLAALKQSGAKTVLDLGCGEGRLLKGLLQDKSFMRIVGMDVSHRALEIASERLGLDRLPQKQKERIELIQGALTYRDRRLAGFDAACVIEVIEHLDPSRLSAFERSLFEFARPRTIIITTPNAEYNVKLEQLPVQKLRHRDHRFEWTRREFQSWANQVAARFGYAVEFRAVGPEDPEVGAPTQMGVFRRG